MSCEDVLDKRELNGVDEADVWENVALANMVLNRNYALVLPGFNGNANTNLSEESFGGGPSNMMYGQLPFGGDIGSSGMGYSVGTYSTIRRINTVIQDIDKGSISANEKEIIRGQAIFLRAWTYWELVKLYGGVPMVMEPQDPMLGEGLYMERDPAAKCIELIVKDLDDAIERLPASWPATEYGKVTKAAAASLKGRVLLFYASPQFNPDNLADRWTAAYEANRQAKEIAQAAGHGLHPNFARVFLDEGNKESIFVTVYDAAQKSHGYENSVRPASVSNTTTTSGNPTWDFVKAFPMKDGKSIKGNPEYDSLLYWKDRDPRFYATVAYNTAPYAFAERPSKRQWTYDANAQEGNQNTRTGFYARKNVNTAIARTETPRTPTDWVEIRYAEVLLNLAESAAEVGKVEEAYTELKAIRQRAGIAAGADNNYGLMTGMSTDQMREAVLLERQIELAYENKRHWDLRRRNLFTERLNGTKRMGILTELNLPYVIELANIQPLNDKETLAQMNTRARGIFENNMADTINWEKRYHAYFTTTFNLPLDQLDINYLQPKYNFYFLPQVELDRDPKIRQTINWTTGDAFDPLAP